MCRVVVWNAKCHAMLPLDEVLDLIEGQTDEFE